MPLRAWEFNRHETLYDEAKQAVYQSPDRHQRKT